MASTTETKANGLAPRMRKRNTAVPIADANGAALAVAPAEPVHTNQTFIDPKKIVGVFDGNPRFDMGELEELATQIDVQLKADPKSGGLLNDMRVREFGGIGEGTFEVVDGKRRLAAIGLLLKRQREFPFGVPVKIEVKDANKIDLLIKMFVANGGKPFLPLEEAAAFKQMRDAKMTIKQIELKTGRNVSSIVGALALLDVDPELTDAIRNKKISGSVAKSIAVGARGDKNKQRELTRGVVAAGKDKNARKEATQAIDDSRRARAAKIGRKLKMRALSDAELSILGARVSEQLITSMGDLGLAVDTDLIKWVKASDIDVRIAFSFGALQAFKAASGIKVPLSVR